MALTIPFSKKLQLKKKIASFVEKYGQTDERAEKFISEFYANYNFGIKKARKLFEIESFKQDFEDTWLQIFITSV